MFKKILKKILLLVIMAGPLVSFAAHIPVQTHPALPDLVTVTDTTAVFTGSANTGGSNLFGYFRYSTVTDHPPIFCNERYGSDMQSTKEELINGSNVSFTKTVPGLLPDTIYYYCAVVSNSASNPNTNPTDISYGGVVEFKTDPCTTCAQTTIITNPATGIGPTSANLKGSYSSTVAVKTYFEYRKVTLNNNLSNITLMFGSINIPSMFTYGNWITPANSDQNHTAGAFGNRSFTLSGLEPVTTYEFRAIAEPNTGTITNPVYGSPINGATLNFTTTPPIIPSGTDPGPGVPGGNNSWTYVTGGGSGWTGTGTGTVKPVVPAVTLKIGTKATPPVDATVRFQEGIETVFARQIVANKTLAKRFGYMEGQNLQSFAGSLAHTFAQIFGYVGANGKEIRVSHPDIAAYQLQLSKGKLTVYEYYNSKIVDIRSLTSVFKNAGGYEYYFNKR